MAEPEKGLIPESEWVVMIDGIREETVGSPSKKYLTDAILESIKKISPF